MAKQFNSHRINKTGPFSGNFEHFKTAFFVGTWQSATPITKETGKQYFLLWSF